MRISSVFGSLGHLSLNSTQAELAICTWRPFIFRRPICGTHGTLLGPSPSLGSDPITAKGRDRKISSVAFIEKLFLPPFFQFYPSSVCKQSLTSSCTHLTPDPSDGAHSAAGATSRGSRYSEIVHHNGPRFIPAFSELCPPILGVLTPLRCLFYLRAVDRAWEYLLFSCCRQHRNNRNKQKREGGITQHPRSVSYPTPTLRDGFTLKALIRI